MANRIDNFIGYNNNLMETRTDFLYKIQQISAVQIYFDTKHQKYLINDIWVEEIDTEYFNDKSYDIEESLNHNLRFVSNKREVLKELYELLWNKIEWYHEHEIQKISFLDAIKSKVRETSDSLSSPKGDKYTIDYVKKFSYDTGEADDLLYTLKRYEADTNFYEKKEDFEKVKLLHALQLHYESIKELYHFLYKLEMDVDTINFDDLSSFESYLKSNLPSKKCTLNLDKISTSVFFSILMESGIIVMDKKPSSNKVKIKKFIEDNFNYTDNEGEVKPIKRINKEMSKFDKGEHCLKQVEILEFLISKFEENIAKVKHLNKRSFANPLK